LAFVAAKGLSAEDLGLSKRQQTVQSAKYRVKTRGVRCMNVGAGERQVLLKTRLDAGQSRAMTAGMAKSHPINERGYWKWKSRIADEMDIGWAIPRWFARIPL
jgi:hypothetical protein